MQIIHKSLEISSKSHRVVALTAACIRAVVRFRFDYDMPVAEAFELARVHDLNSALDRIAAKMELHRNLPSRTKMQLSIVEAALEPNSSEGTSGNVIAVRVKTVENLSAATTSVEDRRALVSSLTSIRTEARSFAKGYSRFFVAMTKLYRQTRSVLAELELSADDKKTALRELEEIMTKAIRDAGKI